jgi:phosphatidylinositol alpha-1,6-mannosyltransferase
MFAGRVANDEMPQIYRRADVAVMPVRSRWSGLEQEGFGIVFAEAGASGLPVVAGRSGGAPEAVIDGVTGFVVDGDSEKEVARATLAVLNDPELHRRMGAAATAHVHAHFDWDVLARTFMDHLAGVNPDR